MSEKNVDSRYRILVDSYVLGPMKKEQSGALIGEIECYNAFGYQGVATEGAAYVRCFQQHPEQFRDLLANKKVLVERLGSSERLTEEQLRQFPFDCSYIETNPFKEMIEGLKKEEEIAAIQAMIDNASELVERNRGTEWNGCKLIPKEMQKEFGLKANSSRYDVFKACCKNDRMQFFRFHYNKLYVKRLAILLECDFVLLPTGKAERVF